MIDKNIEREEIIALLTQDSYYRKFGNWALLTNKDIVDGNRTVKITSPYFIVRDKYWSLVNVSFDKFQSIIEENHPHCTKLLTKFSGHIVAAGGAVCKSIIRNQQNDNYTTHHPNDIDIFFYNLTIEEANGIRIEIIKFLIAKWNTDRIIVTRNKFVTTIYVTVTTQYGYNNTYIYQLIHRIYPNISAIIGGFDLSICMVAYDGKEIYATPLGAWSIINQSILIDLQRRSTSFEHRICKYFNYGINIIFPGLLQKTIYDCIVNPKKSRNYQEVYEKIKELASTYNYHVIDINMINNHKNELLFSDQQQKENILPFLHINDGCNQLRKSDDVGFDHYSYNEIKINIMSYDQKETRYTNKISDYFHKIDTRYIPQQNATRLRLNNLAAVVSVLGDNIEDEVNKPNIQFNEEVIEQYRQNANKARYKDEDEYLDNCRLTKFFGKLVSEVREIRNSEQYEKYVDRMIDIMKENFKICSNNLVGIKWITKNPGRQWTASINPIFEDPRNWYGKHYLPVVTGIPIEIETCLRLAQLRSIWSLLPKDLFDLLLSYIAKNYADDAWQYIL